MVQKSCTFSKTEKQAKKTFFCNNNILESIQALARRLDIGNLDMADCTTISLIFTKYFAFSTLNTIV